MGLGHGWGTGIGRVCFLLVDRGLGVGEGSWFVVGREGGSILEVGGTIFDAGEAGYAGNAGGFAMVEGGGGGMVGGNLEVAVVQVHIVHQLVQHLVEHDTPFTEPHQHQRQLERHPRRKAELTSGVRLVYGVLQEDLDVRESPVARAVGGYAHNGRLHKVVEATEEVPQHSARTYYPHGGAREPQLEQCQGVFQAPPLPLADLLILRLHPRLQILQQTNRKISEAQLQLIKYTYLCVPLEEKDILNRTRRAVIKQTILLASEASCHQLHPNSASTHKKHLGTYITDDHFLQQTQSHYIALSG